ncbi:short chain dehydrogenase [Trinickia fusca]|uniref:Short chain dehydrogenase n=1 Tax=Trinickia fusca TaxID=2419777 RepID=A0A494XLG6_9BURK|nr:short chain dehydrogenase [Trinickia fusca]RKP49496.1 short chain dehydrogenase [Trinickia fusca]
MKTKKVLVVGATGTVGTAVAERLTAVGHEVIRVGRRGGDLQVDIADERSVAALFERVGRIDALVSTTGELHFGALGEMTSAQFEVGLQSKLLGQVRLALVGQAYLNDGGSITLTSGIVGEEPILYGANATAVNAAIDGFVRAAATELARGVRINSVNPTLLTESEGVFGPYFPGFESVPAARVALAYQRSIDGVQTGRVYRVW